MEVKESQYTYHEVFLLGLQCIRDKDTYRLVKIRELEEEVRDLREELNYYDFLKKKLQDKEKELQEKRSELCVSDKFDVIEYNRNKKLNVVVSGLLDRYYSLHKINPSPHTFPILILQLSSQYHLNLINPLQTL